MREHVGKIRDCDWDVIYEKKILNVKKRIYSQLKKRTKPFLYEK